MLKFENSPNKEEIDKTLHYRAHTQKRGGEGFAAGELSTRLQLLFSSLLKHIVIPSLCQKRPHSRLPRFFFFFSLTPPAFLRNNKQANSTEQA